MTNNDDETDVFEQMARNAGSALRRPAPNDGIDRLRSARRRQQIVRSSLAAGAAVIIVVVALIVLKRPDDRTIAPVDSAVPSTTPPTTTTPSATTADPSALRLAYTLAGINGLAPIGEPQTTHVSSYTSLIEAWSTVAGITDGYLVLSESQLPTAPPPEGDIATVDIEVPDGHALLVTDNGFESLTSATRIMWWRADGRLWTVTNFGLTPERLTQLTLAIQPGSGLPYVLPDEAMTFVGFNTAETYLSTRQDWGLGDHFLELGIATGGLAQQLADSVPVSVVRRTIAGIAGYAITQTNGQIVLTWPTDNPDHWGTIALNNQLGDRADEIAAALTPR